VREGVDSSELQYQASLNPANARITCNRLRRNSKRHNDAVITATPLKLPAFRSDRHSLQKIWRALCAYCLLPILVVPNATMNVPKLRILLVGNGGREHTLAWKLAQSERVDCIHVVPGNGGTAG